ncbi:MAG: hypothetical protein HKN03_16300 [Acidimicrobiales bacterium]|nr:hypothetical protein [Acidimicrobiales bacterium]
MKEKQRLRREELRSLMLTVGLEILLEDGLAAGTLPIGYADAFRWLSENRGITVSRAQIHNRIWSSLDEYRQDVLLAMLEYHTTRSVAQTTTEVLEAVDALVPPPSAGEQTDAERRKTAVDLTRAGVEANTIAARSDRETVAFEAVWALQAFRTHKDHAISGEADDRLIEAVKQNQRATLQPFLELYSLLSQRLALEVGTVWGLSPASGLSLFAELLYSINNGAAGRATVETSLQSIRCGSQLWTVESLSAAAVAEAMVSVADRPPPQQSTEGVVVPHVVTNGNNMSASNPTSGRRERIERSRLRAVMLEAGRCWMIENGFGHGAEHVTYARVFERIRSTTGVSINRAQVHGRIWPSQNDFQIDVVSAAANVRPSAIVRNRTEAVSADLVRFDLTKPGESKRAVTELTRVHAAAAVQEMITSPGWLMSTGVAAFHGMNPAPPEGITRALHEAYEKDLVEWVAFFQLFAAVFNYTALPWTELPHDDACEVVARCFDAFTGGVAGRTRMDNDGPTWRLDLNGDGAAEWELLGIGLWCIIHFLFEPAPVELSK